VRTRGLRQPERVWVHDQNYGVDSVAEIPDSSKERSLRAPTNAFRDCCSPLGLLCFSICKMCMFSSGIAISSATKIFSVFPTLAHRSAGLKKQSERAFSLCACVFLLCRSLVGQRLWHDGQTLPAVSKFRPSLKSSNPKSGYATLAHGREYTSALAALWRRGTTLAQPA
jgi:hypothetical protein